MRTLNKTLLAACLLLFNALSVGAQGGAGDEHRLKAAFVFKFPQFVEWPQAALADRPVFEICVDGPGPSAAALRELTSGEVLNGRRLVVRDRPAEQSLSSCQVLFFAGQRLDRELMARAAVLPILTVSDSPAFLDAGGIIQLKMLDRRVRFEVNLPAAARARITLSSQLLRLAAAVRGER